MSSDGEDNVSMDEKHTEEGQVDEQDMCGISNNSEPNSDDEDFGTYTDDNEDLEPPKNNKLNK